MNLNDIIEKHNEVFGSNFTSYTDLDDITLCNIGTDFAMHGMYEDAFTLWSTLEKLNRATLDVYSNLGVSYYYGNGVDENLEKAIHYYQIAAVKGHPYAQYNLAVACENGKGTPVDLEKAILFYEKAAYQHVNQAIDALIRLGVYDEMKFQYFQKNLDDINF